MHWIGFAFLKGSFCLEGDCEYYAVIYIFSNSFFFMSKHNSSLCYETNPHLVLGLLKRDIQKMAWLQYYHKSIKFFNTFWCKGFLFWIMHQHMFSFLFDVSSNSWEQMLISCPKIFTHHHYHYHHNCTFVNPLLPDVPF